MIYENYRLNLPFSQILRTGNLLGTFLTRSKRYSDVTENQLTVKLTLYGYTVFPPNQTEPKPRPWIRPGPETRRHDTPYLMYDGDLVF